MEINYYRLYPTVNWTYKIIIIINILNKATGIKISKLTWEVIFIRVT